MNICTFLYLICYVFVISPSPEPLIEVGDEKFYRMYCRTKKKCIFAASKVRGVAQLASALAWGARGRKFESSHPDQIKKRRDCVSFFLFQNKHQRDWIMIGDVRYAVTVPDRPEDQILHTLRHENVVNLRCFILAKTIIGMHIVTLPS